MSNFLLVCGGSIAAILVLLVVTLAISRRVGRVSVIDVAWAIGFALIALVGLALGDGVLWRRVLLAVLTITWAGRLAIHLAVRSRGGGEDPRYERLLENAPPGRRQAEAVRRVFVPQGLAMFVVSLPLQVSASTGDGIPAVVVAGVLVWAAGLTFEAVGDQQLKAFKADENNHGKIMDRGLWAWTRHPNYFGDFAVWLGLYLVAASAWPGVLTAFSPLAMAYFLVVVTGGRLLEKQMADRPGYADYQARTSFFFPRPPK
ncbi:DUF1295 domain-containing protein [Kribbella sp. NPDC056861]|uniref:DUF1295 domain-containing protein n=1 Tax=Kribbella sp. NPDC056861 TaxID=3154857 RepID=UPI00343F33D4